MPLSHIEHYLVLSDEIDATRDWLPRRARHARGLAPDFGFPSTGCTLEGVDVVHIGKSANASERQPEAPYLGRLAQDAGAGTGAIDHIAFRCAKGLKQNDAHTAPPQDRVQRAAANDRRSTKRSCTTRTASRSS